MGVAVLGGKPFRIDPDSVKWSFDVRAMKTDCIGGKVIQVLGVRMQSMMITGSYGEDKKNLQPSWVLADAFLKQIKEWGRTQAQYPPPPPLRFTYPPLGWDFGVSVLGLESDQRGAVHHTPANFSYKYTLELFIHTDNTNLSKVAEDAYIARLTEGIGWKQTKYNGPASNQSVLDQAGGDVYDYLAKQFQERISGGKPAPVGASE